LSSAFGLPIWLSFLIVGVAAVIVGGLLAYKGIETLKRVQLTPQETVDTLKEDIAWAKDQTT
jgi:hypothetical protein